MCRTLQPSDQARALRQALGQFATGVAVVTARDSRHRLVGMTINSFCSVSLHPALVSWCIDRSAASYMAFAHCTDFTITVLAENQADIAERFASRGARKFQGIEDDGIGAPAIPGGCAEFHCNTYNTVLLGDHLMLIGKVDRFDRTNNQPLVYTQGNFLRFTNNNRLAAAVAA